MYQRLTSRFRTFFLVTAATLVLTATFAAFVPASTSYAAATTDADCNTGGTFLTFHPWYYGLSSYDATSKSCVINSPGAGTVSLQNFIWHIALNVIGILLQIVGYIAAIMIIYGGIQFLTGGDNPTAVAKARTTILDALIGLVISLASTAVINLILSYIGVTSSSTDNGVPVITAGDFWVGALKLAYYLAGAIAVVVMILAGFRYSSSGGDSAAIAKAKNQLLYAIVGLVIVFFAFVITNFVAGRIQG